MAKGRAFRRFEIAQFTASLVTNCGADRTAPVGASKEEGRPVPGLQT